METTLQTPACYITEQSRHAFAQAQTLMPGGVNSPVRAFKSVGGHPVFIQKAQGPYVWDIDGNRYIDYVASWGPAILGHAHPAVIQKIQAVAENGTSFGAPTVLENQLAAKVIELVPGIEKVRFVNSGTEAVMSTVRLARAATGRQKIIKFDGCYHGHADYLLVKAGSGAGTLGIPDSPGVLPATAAATLIAPYNDLAAVQTLLQAHPDEVAAILVEPVAGNMGCVPPHPGFLQGLRNLCDQFGALLIFDEVMTGFRVALGGAQAYYNVTPDITALGKIIGGGLPVGAYGARADLMAHVAPEGPMYQAGTLSGNPLAMAAGLETLTQLQAPGLYDALSDTTAQLAQGLASVCAQKGVPATTTHVGAMFSLFFTPGPVHNFADAATADRQRFNTFFHHMLSNNIYLAPSPFESGFVSTTHTADHITTTLSTASAALQ